MYIYTYKATIAWAPPEYNGLGQNTRTSPPVPGVVSDFLTQVVNEHRTLGQPYIVSWNIALFAFAVNL